MDRQNRNLQTDNKRISTVRPLVQWAFAFICLTLFATSAYAQDPAQSDAGWQVVAEPSWGSQAQPNAIKGKGVRKGRFYNLIERQHRYDEHASSSVTYLRYMYTITNAAGLDSGAQVSIDYDPFYESVQLHKVLVHRDNESIDQIDPSSIKLLQRETELDKGLYNGEQTLHMLLPDQRVGDQIEISYSIIGDNPVFDSRIFGWVGMQVSVPVGNYYFKLRYPSTKSMHTRVYDGDLQTSTSTDLGFTEQVWTNKSAKAQSYQSDVPAGFNAQTTLQYSEFKNWNEVSEWATPLYAAGATAPEIKEYVAQLKAESDDIDQQISSAITFIQDKVRYTGINSGIGGFKPDAPADIFNRRFGDCKDKAVLLVAILKELGITAYPVLVHSKTGSTISDYLPSPDAFNHMIVQLPNYKGETYWIDGTINLQGSSLASLVQGAYSHALIPAQSDQGLVAYTVTPLEKPEKEVVETYDIKFNHEATPTLITVSSTLRGYEAERLRRAIHNNSIGYFEDLYLNYYQSRFDEVSLAEDIHITDNRADNIITVFEQYESQSALTYDEETSTETNAEYALYVYAESMTSDLSMPSDKRRHQPLSQAHPVNVLHKIVLRHADGWSIKDQSNSISNEYFEYKTSNSRAGKNLILNYELKTLASVVSVADSRRYLNDLKDMLDDPYYGVSLTVNSDDLRTTKLDNQFSLIGNWISQNIELLSQDADQ